MQIPVVRRAVESARGVYTSDDYSMLQLMAEVGESEPGHPQATGPYVLFQVYTGSLGFWSYEWNTPFMGLANLDAFIGFVRTFGWPELLAALEAIPPALQRYTPDQLTAFESFSLDDATHAEIHRIVFPESITQLIVDDAKENDHAMFRRACEYLEATVEFLTFEDGAALRSWRAQQN